MQETESLHIGHVQSVVGEQLTAWATEGRTLLRTAAALHLDPTKFLAGFTLPASSGAPRARASGTPASARTRSRTRTRKPTGAQTVGPQMALSWLGEHPGISARQLAQGIGISTDTAQRYMRELEHSGQARREGERNQTRWFSAVADLVGAAA